MGAGAGLDPALDAFLRKLASGLVRALGPVLTGLYLHGSAADLAAADRFVATVLARLPGPPR